MGRHEQGATNDGTPSIRRAAVSGAVWILLGSLSVQGGRLAFNLVLQRLLAPQVFGLMALVSLFLQGLHMFSDLGIRQVVVASPQGEEPAFLDTAWTLQALRGAVLALASWVIAGPLAQWYGQPDFRWLIPLTGLTALLNGLDGTGPMVLARRLVRGPLVLMEAGTYFVSIAVIIGVMVAEPLLVTGLSQEEYRLRALAVGPLAGAVFELVVSHLLRPRRRPRLSWAPEPGRLILGFGGWVFLSSACTFLAAQADRLVIGKVSVGQLGVYHVAAMLAGVPALLLFNLSSQLVFPICAQLVRSGDQVRVQLTRVYWLAAAAAGMTATGLIGAGPSLVACLCDQRYQGADLLLQLLAAGVWLTMLMATRERVLEARRQTQCLAAAQGVKLIALAIALPQGLALGGLPGAALSMVAAEAARYLVILWLCRKEGLPGPLGDLALTVLMGAAACVALAAAGLPGPPASSWLRLALAVPAGLLPWGVLLAVACWRQRAGRVIQPAFPSDSGDARQTDLQPALEASR